MADFLVELLANLFDSVVPRRANELIVAFITLVLGCAFAALALFVVQQIFHKKADLVVGLAAVAFAALSAISFKLMVKGIRGRKSPPRQGPAQN